MSEPLHTVELDLSPRGHGCAMRIDGRELKGIKRVEVIADAEGMTVVRLEMLPMAVRLALAEGVDIKVDVVTP